MNSFFFSVSFPQTRWQANCVFRSVATRKHNETLRLWPGSAEPCEAIGARVRTQVKTFKSYNLCPDSYRSRWSGMAFHSFLQRRFALRKVVRLLPIIRGRLFYVSHFVIFCFCSHLFFILPLSSPPLRKHSGGAVRNAGAFLPWDRRSGT